MKKKLIIFGAALLTTYCVLGLARADGDAEITWQGRTETAHCEFKYIDPVIETCVSRSWVCMIRDGEMSCSVNRGAR